MDQNLRNLPGWWFSEVNDDWHGHAFSLKVKELLHHEKSKYQDIVIFDSESYGRVLALDGVIQCTSRDEFSYQEMIAHLPLFSHPCPKSVLVVGGGDGGVLREVLKHPTVEIAHLCEIDEKVIELSKKYLPHMAVGFDSPKVTVYVEDGMKFLSSKKEAYDVIITDSSDPIGPAEVLFGESYFSTVKEALKPNGIMCMQGECMWLRSDLDLIEQVVRDMKELYPVTKYAFTTVPTYTSGQIGFVLSSKNKDTVFERPTRVISAEEADRLNLRYYDSQVHRAAFILPRFVKMRLTHDLEQ